MANPWVNLPKQPPFVIPDDVGHLDRYPEASRRFRFEVIPIPFIGTPWTARVVVLTRNPGFYPGVIHDEKDLAYRDALIANLTFEYRYPFVFLDPAFGSKVVGQWWGRRLRNLINAVGRDKVAEGLFVIYWFPYRTAHFAPPPRLLPSQAFGLELAEQSLESDRVFVIMHAENLWLRHLPQLREANYIKLSSTRSAYLSTSNVSEGSFRRIVDALSS